MYGCESWTVKKAERRRIDAFELWCWRRLLRVPWTSRRSNQSVLKEISPGYLLEGLMSKLKLQYFWPPVGKNRLIWKDPDGGKDWGQEEKETTEDEIVGWHHWLNGRGFGWTLGVGDGQGGLVCCGSWGCKELDMTEWLNWNLKPTLLLNFPGMKTNTFLYCFNWFVLGFLLFATQMLMTDAHIFSVFNHRSIWAACFIDYSLCLFPCPISVSHFFL